MNDDRTSKLIDKLASDTKNNLIQWQRFLAINDNKDNNKMIQFFCEVLYNEEDEDIKEEVSYYASYKGGLIFVFTLIDPYNYDSKYLLSIQKDKYSKVTVLNHNFSLKSEIKRLQYLIEEQINDVDDFLDSLLED